VHRDWEHGLRLEANWLSIRVKAKELLRLVVAAEKTVEGNEYAELHSLRYALESFLNRQQVKVLRWPRETEKPRSLDMIPFMD